LDLHQILKAAYDAGASDVHLVAGNPPVMRVNQVMTARSTP
jgi:Tfp pilus assembly pilus retraction ATPase PilT